MPNVNLDGTDAQRATTLAQTISACVEEIQPSSNAATKTNVKKFLLHVAWHEGRFLKTRVQDPAVAGGPPGPGRSFYQFEPPRAREAVEYANQKEAEKGWLTLLATHSGQTKQALLDAAAALTGGSWPQNNVLDQLLRESDVFATYLTRIAFAKIPAGIPEGNLAHANYWADHWKIVFDSDGPHTRALLVPIFEQKSNTVDGLVTPA